MKKIIYIIIFLVGIANVHSQIYMGKTCDVSFFSKGPSEDIYAITNVARPIFNSATNEIAIKIIIKGFVFDKKLMEEHFNEKYMESDKYPYATFTGKINQPFDVKKNGTYKITITGKLTIHGVEKERTISGTVTIKNGKILFESKFPVALKDHHIEIPTLVAENISEVVQVTVKSTLTEYKK